MTLWGLGTAFLIFPLLRLPPLLTTTAGTLLAAELVVLLVHSYGSEGCDPEGCSVLTTAAGALASQDLPALAVGLYVVAIGHGLRTRRLTTRSR